jgi:hypothetical protein
MRLKKAIQIIQNAGAITIFIVVFAVIAIAERAKAEKLFLPAILVGLLAIIAYFLRGSIIRAFLKRSLYQGVYLSVLEKMKLSDQINFTLTDDQMNEFTNPSYSTNQFLNDNGLKTEIGKKKMHFPSLIVLAIGTIIMLVLVAQRIKPEGKTSFYLMTILFMGALIFLWIRGKKQQNDTAPVVVFSENGLQYFDKELAWSDIYFWDCIPAIGRNEHDRILINHYDIGKNIHEMTVKLEDIDSDMIDFLLLLTHYKEKFG